MTELRATPHWLTKLPQAPEAESSDATKHKKAVRVWQGVSS